MGKKKQIDFSHFPVNLLTRYVHAYGIGPLALEETSDRDNRRIRPLRTASSASNSSGNSSSGSNSSGGISKQKRFKVRPQRVLTDRVSLVNAAQEHFESVQLSELETVVSFLYVAKNKDKTFRLKFCPTEKEEGEKMQS